MALSLHRFWPSGHATSEEPCRHLVVFLHGRLAGPGVPPPRKLYAEICQDIVDAAPGKAMLLLPEFHELYPQLNAEEPRDLRLGPCSLPIVEAILIESRNMQEITLIGYSMGVFLLFKCLHARAREEWGKRLAGIILLEPVVNCWIPKAEPTVLVEDVRCVALYGEYDSLVRKDMGILATADCPSRCASVKRRLEAYLPGVKVCELPGVNHLGIMSSLSERTLRDSLPDDGLSLPDLKRVVIGAIIGSLDWPFPDVCHPMSL
eukprot:TRINITY_DN27094_c0_g1_i1.p1 TRINITY_DN27094_c0_g1~~TRINITY_DN27094_c0_g1_i1.p1  ORF type:complete len:262 (+),score=30.65 TRINITY_DN27094_c0_g1_i1:71-856(+)